MSTGKPGSRQTDTPGKPNKSSGIELTEDDLNKAAGGASSADYRKTQLQKLSGIQLTEDNLNRVTGGAGGVGYRKKTTEEEK
jgi:hypothetical protein